MLNRVRLENFKAWQEADVGLGRISGFFGANSAGKSSLLQFLLLLKQTRNATDRGLVLDFGGPTALVNLGTFEDTVHGHDLERRIRWTLEWERRAGHRGALSADQLVPDAGLRIRCGVGVRRIRLPQPNPWACELGYGSGDVEYLLRPTEGSETKFELVSEGGISRSSETSDVPGLSPDLSRRTCSPARSGATSKTLASLATSSWSTRA